MRPDSQRHFLALELSPGASANDIRGAYRKLIQKWHPDRFAAGSLMQTTAEDQTKELNEAYDWLYKKRHYRKFLGETNRPKPPPVARPVETADPPPEAEVKPPAPAAPPRPPPGRSWARPFLARAQRHWRKVALAAGVAAAITLVHLFGAPLGRRWRSAPSTPPPTMAAAAPQPSRPAVAAASSAATPDGQPAQAMAPARPPGERPFLSLAPSARPELPALAPIAPPPVGGARALAYGGATPLSAPTRARGRAQPSWAAAIVLPTEAPAIETKAAAARARRLDEAEAELQTFDLGDSADRVRSLQGPPDETIPGALRYGSSIVYFENGRVTSWVNGWPRLRISPFASIDLLDGIDAFTLGSTRDEVFKIQGRPDAVFANTYIYGANAVYFANDRVISWIRTYGSLRAHLPLEPLFGDPSVGDPWSPSHLLRDF